MACSAALSQSYSLGRDVRSLGCFLPVVKPPEENFHVYPGLNQRTCYTKARQYKRFYFAVVPGFGCIVGSFILINAEKALTVLAPKLDNIVDSSIMATNDCDDENDPLDGVRVFQVRGRRRRPTIRVDIRSKDGGEDISDFVL